MDPEIEAALSALTDSTMGTANRLDAGHSAAHPYASLSLFAEKDETEEETSSEFARRRLHEVRRSPAAPRPPAWSVGRSVRALPPALPAAPVASR